MPHTAPEKIAPSAGNKSGKHAGVMGSTVVESVVRSGIAIGIKSENVPHADPVVDVQINATMKNMNGTRKSGIEPSIINARYCPVPTWFASRIARIIASITTTIPEYISMNPSLNIIGRSLRLNFLREILIIMLVMSAIHAAINITQNGS